MSSTVINHAAAIKRLEALFDDVKLEPKAPTEICKVEAKHDAKCDVHGGKGNRRGSLGNVLHTPNFRESTGNLTYQRRDSRGNVGNGVGPRRESMPALNVQSNYYNRRRDSLGLPQMPPNKDIEHPSNFPSLLRKDPLVASMVTLRKDGYFNSGWNSRRDSLTGSTNSLKKDFLQVPTNRRNSRRFSNDSLDSRRNSWDPGRRGSCGSSGGWDDPILENERKIDYWYLSEHKVANWSVDKATTSQLVFPPKSCPTRWVES
ncbi:hypothetical protein ILUMI_22100 [Ignelater luminosus]|uniref:Uncharacterized protein n=1 Tax=Ignelater luminosus TaxID=2038154 RepID=A0A8K0CF65_IGNLU|nr:hypothetical protein ILUMI_22100 [Ignelater luminosus]